MEDGEGVDIAEVVLSGVTPLVELISLVVPLCAVMAVAVIDVATDSVVEVMTSNGDVYNAGADRIFGQV